MKPLKIAILLGLVALLSGACKDDPLNPALQSLKIDKNHLLFEVEDSCRLIPFPPAGPLMEYNDFPDQYLTRTVAHNPENPCEYLVRVTRTDPLGQFYLIADLCQESTREYEKFPPGTRAFPVWFSNNWFVFVFENDIWKMKVNGDSISRIVPNSSGKIAKVSQQDPKNPDYFYYSFGTTHFRADMNGNNIDTLERGYRLSSDGNKGLGIISGESIGYIDLEQGNEYVPVSTKYKREFGGSWHPDGKHFAWLLQEQVGDYPIVLSVFDVYTQEEQIISTYSCTNRNYFGPKFTQDGKWVYMHLQYRESLGGRDAFADWFTVFIHVETGQEYWGSFEP